MNRASWLVMGVVLLVAMVSACLVLPVLVGAMVYLMGAPGWVAVLAALAAGGGLLLMFRSVRV